MSSGIHPGKSGHHSKFCSICSEEVTWSESAKAYFHSGGYVGTIAREVTSKPLIRPLKAVMPTPVSGIQGFTVPGTSRKIDVL